jgi:hypothetical protein
MREGYIYYEKTTQCKSIGKLSLISDVLGYGVKTTVRVQIG